jgi:hypothetical protein
MTDDMMIYREQLSQDYPPAFIARLSDADAKRLWELRTLRNKAWDDAIEARALAEGTNLTDEQHHEVWEEVIVWDVDKADPQDPVTLLLNRWHELQDEVRVILEKYQDHAQAVADAASL